MRKLKPTKKFNKSVKKISNFPKKLKALNNVLNLLKKETPLPQKYQEHKLKGDKKIFFECHILPDLLLIYLKTNTHIHLINIGSHSDLFR